MTGQEQWAKIKVIDSQKQLARISAEDLIELTGCPKKVAEVIATLDTHDQIALCVLARTKNLKWSENSYPWVYRGKRLDAKRGGSGFSEYVELAHDLLTKQA